MRISTNAEEIPILLNSMGPWVPSYARQARVSITRPRHAILGPSTPEDPQQPTTIFTKHSFATRVYNELATTIVTSIKALCRDKAQKTNSQGPYAAKPAADSDGTVEVDEEEKVEAKEHFFVDAAEAKKDSAEAKRVSDRLENAVSLTTSCHRE